MFLPFLWPRRHRRRRRRPGGPGEVGEVGGLTLVDSWTWTRWQSGGTRPWRSGQSAGLTLVDSLDCCSRSFRSVRFLFLFRIFKFLLGMGANRTRICILLIRTNSQFARADLQVGKSRIGKNYHNYTLKKKAKIPRIFLVNSFLHFFAT